MRITLDPVNGPSQVRITSPRYSLLHIQGMRTIPFRFPSKYPNRASCEWTVRVSDRNVSHEISRRRQIIIMIMMIVIMMIMIMIMIMIPGGDRL